MLAPSHVNPNRRLLPLRSLPGRPGWAAPCLQVCRPQRGFTLTLPDLPLRAVFLNSSSAFLQPSSLYFLRFVNVLFYFKQIESPCIRPVSEHSAISPTAQMVICTFSHKCFLIKVCMVLFFEIGSQIDQAGLELTMWLRTRAKKACKGAGSMGAFTLPCSCLWM